MWQSLPLRAEISPLFKRAAAAAAAALEDVTACRWPHSPMTPRVFDLYKQHRIAVNVWFACMLSELHMGSLESIRQDHSGEEWPHFSWFKGSTLTNMTTTFARIPWSICDHAAHDVSFDLQWRPPQKVDAFLILSCSESQPEFLKLPSHRRRYNPCCGLSLWPLLLPLSPPFHLHIPLYLFFEPCLHFQQVRTLSPYPPPSLPLVSSVEARSWVIGVCWNFFPLHPFSLFNRWEWRRAGAAAARVRASRSRRVVH